MAKTAENEEWRTKCAFSGKALQKNRRYYRNGKYYLNKTAFKAQLKKEQEEKAGEAAAN